MATAVNGLPPGFEIEPSGISGGTLPGEGPGPGRQVAGSRVDPRQAIRAPAPPRPTTPRMPTQPQQQPAAAGVVSGLPPGFEIEQPVAAPPQREVGIGEGIARIIGQASVPVTRSLGLAAGTLANLIGGEQAQDAVFKATDEAVANMRREYEFRPEEQVGLPTQVAGGILSAPIELVGGFGAQRGIDTAAEVLRRGGTGEEAAKAGGVSGAVNVGLNLLPVKAGGAVGRAVERQVARGIGQKAAPIAAGALTGGAIAGAGDVAGTAAENAALPEGEEFADMRRESSPGMAAGLGAAFGGAAGRMQGRGSRKAAAAVGEPVSAVEADIAPAEKPPAIDQETLRLARKAQDYGIPLRPDMLSDSRMAKFIGDVMEKVPLGGSKAGERQKAFNRAVMDQLGADKKAEALTPEVFDEALTRAGKEIGDISARTSVPMEDFGDLADLARRETPDVQQVVGVYARDLQRVAEANDGIVPGDQLRKLRTEAATQARGSSNGDLRRSLGEFVDRLDDAIERRAPAEDTEALTDARRRYAVAKTLEPLVAKSPTGDISPAGLMGRVTADRAGKSRMARGRGGELGDLARIGQRFLKEPPSSGTAERLAAGGAVAGVGTGALLSPAAAATAAGAIGAANLYNRLGPKMVERKLAKGQSQERIEPAAMELEEAPDAPAAPNVAAKPVATDPRLSEIDQLRASTQNPEVLAVLDERQKAVETELADAQAERQRNSQADELEALARVSADPELRRGLAARAEKLRGGPIPVGEAREVTVQQAEPAAPIEPTQIPTGEATELTPEQVEPAPRPTEAQRSAAGSDAEAELTLLQPGAPARGTRRQPVGDMKKGGQVPANPFKARAELENTLRAKFGHKLIDALQKRNVITMGDAPADVPRDAQGRFTGNTVELFHDRLDADTAPGVLMHEVGMHYGMAKMLGAQRYAELLADVAKMRQRPEVAKAWAEVEHNYPDLEVGGDDFVSEVGAHLVESAPNQPIVRRMIDAPRAYLYRQFGVNVGKTDPGLLRALATGALRKSAGVEAVSPNPAALATGNARDSGEDDRSPYNTRLNERDEDEFRRWVKANDVPFDADADETDYDMRGFWKAAKAGDERAETAINSNDGRIHYPDFWKTPLHRTFSNESKWAKPDSPHWEGDRLIDKNGRVVFDEAAVTQ